MAHSRPAESLSAPAIRANCGSNLPPFYRTLGSLPETNLFEVSVKYACEFTTLKFFLPTSPSELLTSNTARAAYWPRRAVQSPLAGRRGDCKIVNIAVEDPPSFGGADEKGAYTKSV